MANKLNEKRKRNNSIVDRANNGEGKKELAEEFGLSLSRVNFLLRRADESGSKAKKDEKAKMKESVITTFKDGKTIQETADILNTTISVVNHYIQHNKETKEIAEKRKLDRKLFLKQKKEEVVALTKGGMKTIEIVEHTGLSRTLVSEIIKKAGLSKGKGVRVKLEGMTIGNVEVLSFSHSDNGRTKYNTKCNVCGYETIQSNSNLREAEKKGNNGCKNCYANNNPTITHGMSKTRLYKIYRGMNNRCYNNNDANNYNYKHYGGRGITVCDEWLGQDGVITFMEWAHSNGYSDDLSIDRIDVNGNYEPNNCRWATNEVQANNKRLNKKYNYKGEYNTVYELCKKFNKDVILVRTRVYKGKTIKEAMDVPYQTKDPEFLKARNEEVYKLIGSNVSVGDVAKKYALSKCVIKDIITKGNKRIKDDVIKLFNIQEEFGSIAKKFHITERMVKTIINKYADIDKLIVKQLKSGVRAYDVAKSLQVHYSQVIQTARRNDINLFEIQKQNFQIRDEDIVNKVRSGDYTTKDMADKYNISITSVRLIVSKKEKEMGVFKDRRTTRFNK